MFKNLVVFTGLLGLAFSILLISVLRSASIKYSVPPQNINGNTAIVLGDSVVVDYNLPNPGKVMPGSLLWPVKAARDKVWYAITTNPGREADLLLLFADKRLASGKIQIEEGKVEEGYTTLTKAEKYLSQAWEKEQENRLAGDDTSEFLQHLTLSFLKHYEVMQNLQYLIPEEMRPGLVQLQGNNVRMYKQASEILINKGINPPDNPFDWE